MRHGAGKTAMFGSFVVEMVVGLLATFALFGLCVRILTEVVQTYISSIRVNNPEQCLRQLFSYGEEGQAQFFMDKCVPIRSFSPCLRRDSHPVICPSR
jgi:hypothetical protein